MHRKILHWLLSLLVVVTATVSSAYQIPIVNATTQTAESSQATPKIEGNWQGTLAVGADKLRLILKISKAADGKLTATMDSLDQGANDLAVDTISFEDGTLKFEMKRISASYEGTLNKEGNQFTGKFTQGSVHPLEFKRVTDASQLKLRRPQTPTKPYPYDDRTVYS